MNETDMPAETRDYTDDDWAAAAMESAQPVSIGAISAALAAAQGEFGAIVRDKTVSVTMRSGGKYTFSYAPLESILHAVKPALAKNGLALTQALRRIGKREFVETTLRHSSGQSLSNLIPIFVKDEGPQAYGSALTYARRYGVTLLLCISADDDDDGNAAEGNSASHTNGPTEIEAKLLASNFKAALDMESDQRIFDLHNEHNANQELYSAAWRFLSSTERREIKGAIERCRTPNTNRPERANA